jgi:hypothetical protein
MQPFWLERQTDLDGPDFLPGEAGRDPVNLTHRSWSLVGTVASPDRGIVDPRGLVTPGDPAAGSGWSLDWWVGADDRWHTPSTEAAVRQRLVGDAPVIETLMRIPGGDAVQRVYAIHATTDSPFGQAFLVVEIENASAVPFALGLAVRPYNPIGTAAVETIAMESIDHGGSCVLVNGEVGVLLPKTPARAAACTRVEGDVADLVLSGDAPASFEPVRCDDGGAQAALIYPLPHTAVFRVALPLGPVAGAGQLGGQLGSQGRLRRGSGTGGPAISYPAAVPEAEQVAKGWETQTRRGLRVSLPDPVWESAVQRGRRWLLVAHGGEDLAGWPARPLDWVAAEPVLGALGEQGFGDAAAQVLATLPERQALDGGLTGPAGTASANGAALVALARHVELVGDTAWAEELVGSVAKAVHWIDKRRAGKRRVLRGDPALTPTDLAWSIRGLQAAAGLLDDLGQPDVAADARAFARAAAADLARLDEGAVDRPESASASGVGHGPGGVAVVDPVARAGLSPWHTITLARAELAAGEPRALERLAWVLSVASPTGTWPEVLHPRTGAGSAGDGHHVQTGAEVLRFIRDLLVRETDQGLALCTLVPEGWLGQGLEVHDAPTAFGRLSYAVRWHGERPALLWDLDLGSPPRAGGPVVLTVPGLDPTWQSSEPRGEALLAAPRRGATEPEPSTEPTGEIDLTPPDPGASFS